MKFETILYDVKDEILTITLNRPDKLNAWTRQMLRVQAAAFVPARISPVAGRRSKVLAISRALMNWATAAARHRGVYSAA